MNKFFLILCLGMPFAHASVEKKDDKELNARFDCLQVLCSSKDAGTTSGCYIDREHKRIAFDHDNLGKEYYFSNSNGTYYTETVAGIEKLEAKFPDEKDPFVIARNGIT